MAPPPIPRPPRPLPPPPAAPPVAVLVCPRGNPIRFSPASGSSSARRYHGIAAGRRGARAAATRATTRLMRCTWTASWRRTRSGSWARGPVGRSDAYGSTDPSRCDACGLHQRHGYVTDERQVSGSQSTVATVTRHELGSEPVAHRSAGASRPGIHRPGGEVASQPAGHLAARARAPVGCRPDGHLASREREAVRPSLGAFRADRRALGGLDVSAPVPEPPAWPGPETGGPPDPIALRAILEEQMARHAEYADD